MERQMSSSQRLYRALLRLARKREKRHRRFVTGNAAVSDVSTTNVAKPKAKAKAQILDGGLGQPAGTSVQTLLSSVPLPALNPFLVAMELIKQDYSQKRKRKERQIKITYLVPKAATPIRTAKEVKTYDINIPTTSDLENARVIAKNLYARHHWIESSDLIRFVIPARLNDKFPRRGDATATILDALINDGTAIQCEIMAFYLQGVKTAVEAMGNFQTFEQNLDLWKAAGRKERMRTFARLFDKNPLDVAHASLRRAAVAVPLHDIFSDSTPEHKKWQQFHRTVFCLACEHTFEFRLSSEKDQRTGDDGCFAKWKAMTKSAMFERMDLGDIGDIPVQWSAGLLRVRQPLRLPAGTGHDDDDYDFDF